MSEDRRKFEADVAYEVWQGGGNPDNVDLDGIDDAFYAGVFPEDVAMSELQRQQPRHQQEEEQ